MGKGRGGASYWLYAILVFGALLIPTASAWAAEAPPPLFTVTPEDQVPGPEAGRLSEPNAVAVDPTTRHFFVIEQQQGSLANNNRISEFTAWGEFVKAFGWGVDDGADELQVCTRASGCQKGIEGSQPGQFERPNGLAFDAAGNLYVFERRNSRVQKFDPTAGPEGKEVELLLNWGSAGTGDGQFFVENLLGVNGNYIAVDPTDEVTVGGTVYVADKGRVQAFDTSGNFKFKFALPQNLNPGALAYDPQSGDLYFAFNQETASNVTRPTVYRLEPPSGTVVDEITPDLEGELVKDAPVALAVDPLGNLYVINDPVSNTPKTQPRVQKYDSSGILLTEFDEIGPSEYGDQQVSEPGLAATTVGSKPEEVGIYVGHRRFPDVSSIKIYGAVPDPALAGPPPPVPPTIRDQYAISVAETEARVRAAINPNFWSDTTYYVEYGPAPCEAGGCADLPTPPGLPLTTQVTKAAITSQGILLTGLEPGTEYFYRFVAQSSGGGPVYGVDPDGDDGPEEASFEDGLEATFVTRSTPAGGEVCPANEAFRLGPSMTLPDCRVYEMVSPIDKNGADISVVMNVTGFPAGFDRADSGGDELSFAAYRAFGDAAGAPYAVQYLSSRSDGGWSSHSLAPPRAGPSFLETPDIDAEYRALNPDLSQAWLFRQTDPLLDPGAPAGYPNLYRRDNATGVYEALITAVPPNPPGKFLPVLQGFGGKCTVFRANDALTGNAAASTEYQLYRHCPGQSLQLVSLLPSGTPAAEASAGTGSFSDRTSMLDGAVSEDGQTVFWSDKTAGEGKLYARIGDNSTVALSKGAAQFWAGAADGSVAIFREDEKLYEFRVGVNAEEAPTLIAEKVNGVMGASDDAAVVYFVSREDLGGAAVAGQPNLYRYQVGPSPAFAFIATLGAEDGSALSNGLPGPIKFAPIYHTSQVTPDGGAVAFTSVAPLTGFDNTDAETGEADTEVFVYRAGPDQLVCVSCDSSGARPAGREVPATGNGQVQATAGELPGAANSFYAPRVITDDGSRVYFNSYVPLVSADVNGNADVYQWEALGRGSCKEGAAGYDVSYAGCVSLISSGESAQDSKFVDASSDGRDVFFKTNASLLPQDPGLVDIYDAREGGGFLLPPPPPPRCQEEACQSPGPPPPTPAPASRNFQGSGNVKHCPKGTRKVTKAGKQVCVKKKKRKAKRGKRSGKSGSGAAR